MRGEENGWRQSIQRCMKDLGVGERLDKHAVKAVVTSVIGLRPSKFEVEQVMQRFGTEVEGKAMVDRSTLEEILVDKLRDADVDDLVRQMFMAFDVRCRGFLTYQDTLESFRLVFPSVSPKVVLDAFKAADRDGDGRVGYAEFSRMMQGVEFR